MENSLDDLRSLFAFLLPGYLATPPSDARGEERAWHDERLRAQTAPYILRRTKRAVAPELPARIEQVVWCELTPEQAAAYRELFKAVGGGALGLFTAIARLKAVHRRILKPLSQAGLPLYAQHVDPIDTGTLVDMFRAERHASLLGTDAVRDGVDVPGRSLRLIVFDRVPWSRPDILHRARKAAWRERLGGGANGYDDMLARLRLKQAYGRLIRRADDRGVFVMLDSRLPSRLLGAFPAGVPIERTGLAEAIAAVKAFLGDSAEPPPTGMQAGADSDVPF